MSKFKKILLSILSLTCATSLAVACGKKGGNNGESSSSVSQSSSSVGEESSSVGEESSSMGEESSSMGEENSSVEEESSLSTDGESSSEDPHVCITEGEWVVDENGHWLECTCGEKVAYGEHKGESSSCDKQAVCEICEEPFGTIKDHAYGELSDGEFGKAYYCDCGAYITNENLVDFVVEAKSDKEFVVLQLTDPQICAWGDRDKYCHNYIREAVKKAQPDLIIVTGDIVHGRADPNGTLLAEYIEVMESFDIPWAPVFGNHDNESLMGVDWQCAQFEAAENCLFKTGDVSGNGNYSVGIEQNGELLRVFYMLDSGGCGHPMIDKDGNHTEPAPGTNIIKTQRGFDADQIAWYTDSINAIHDLDEDVKISFAYHIQQAIFEKAFQKYDEYDGVHTSDVLKNPLDLETMENADETDFGYLGRVMKSAWDTDYAIFNGMKALGVDSIFVGHEHCNSASIVYEGVRFQYGQKSSLYDRYNWINNADGSIEGGYNTTPFDDPITPLVGGTVIPVSQVDGSIGTGYIAYYGDPFDMEEPTPVEPWGQVANVAPLTDGKATDEGTVPSGYTTLYKKTNYVKGDFSATVLDASYTELRFAFYADKALVCRGNSLVANRVYNVALTKDAENDWHITITGDGLSLTWEDGYDNNELQDLVLAIKPADGVTDVTFYCTEVRVNAQ